MKTRLISQTIARLKKLLASLSESDQRLHAMFFYEDTPTQMWATEIFEQAKECVSPTALQATWWKLDDLTQPGVLAGAVSKAMRADIVVVATHASEGLPLPFYFWVNAWLPHHPQRRGVLVGLLGVAEKRNRYAGRLRKYFRVAARHAQLKLLLEECRMPEPITGEFPSPPNRSNLPFRACLPAVRARSEFLRVIQNPRFSANPPR